jgi:tRNA U34 5-methylaminomethyl-2-thiouridine-forming methyltransferase MnmC
MTRPAAAISVKASVRIANVKGISMPGRNQNRCLMRGKKA